MRECITYINLEYTSVHEDASTQYNLSESRIVEAIK